MFALFDYSSLSYIVLALSSVVTNLSNKTLIFHDFQGPTIKFHDFPGFPKSVQTLILGGYYKKSNACERYV